MVKRLGGNDSPRETSSARPGARRRDCEARVVGDVSGSLWQSRQKCELMKWWSFCCVLRISYIMLCLYIQYIIHWYVVRIDKLSKLLLSSHKKLKHSGNSIKKEVPPRSISKLPLSRAWSHASPQSPLAAMPRSLAYLSFHSRICVGHSAWSISFAFPTPLPDCLLQISLSHYRHSHPPPRQMQMTVFAASSWKVSGSNVVQRAYDSPFHHSALLESWHAHHFLVLPKHSSLAMVVSLALAAIAWHPDSDLELVADSDLQYLQNAELEMLEASVLLRNLPVAQQGLCAALPEVCCLCGFFAAHHKRFAKSSASESPTLAILASDHPYLWLDWTCLLWIERKPSEGMWNDFGWSMAWNCWNCPEGCYSVTRLHDSVQYN